MSRTVPFAERRRGEEPHVEPETAAILGPDGQPARLPKTAKCPQCGAGADKRVRSGMGKRQQVTCENCAYSFEDVNAEG